MQVVADSASVDFRVVDLTARPPSGRWSDAERLIQEEALRPFDLARDLMIRAMLILCDRDVAIFFINLHHIASDGYSKAILFREIAEFYRAFANGDNPHLPDLPIQYADYAAWQRQQMRGETYERLLSYWKGKLAGAPPLLELPADRPRPPVQSFRGAVRSRDLPASLLGGLNDLSRACRATLFMTLLAAYKTVLMRCTGAEDLVVGTPIANRDRPEVAGLMGFFINTLVLRTDLSGDPTFRELVERVRTTTLDAFDHQEMPFEKLVTELNPRRDSSYTPVIQSLFAVGHAKGGHAQDPAPNCPAWPCRRSPSIEARRNSTSSSASPRAPRGSSWASNTTPTCSTRQPSSPCWAGSR